MGFQPVVSTVADARRILARCEYPGMEFWIEESFDDPYTPFLVRLIYTTFDTRDPGKKIRVSAVHRIMPGCNEAQFVREVYLGVVEMMRHEAAERFLYDDRIAFDPHKEARM